MTTFKLRVKEGSVGCFPNICVPLAGVIDFYRSERGCLFVESKSWRSSGLLAHSGTIHPHNLEETTPPVSFLNKVWKFTEDTHYEIVSGIIASLRCSATMGKDVLSGVELALNEVTDNTLQHSLPNSSSSRATGYVMAQYSKQDGRIAVAVFDSGQGISASLREGGIPIRTPQEGLEKALIRGVTDGKGAGNGLWMMERIILASSGSFDLTSDGACHSLRNADPRHPRAVFSRVNKMKSGTTLVDFQVSTRKDISIEKALGSEHVDLWTERHLDEEGVNAIISVKQESSGYGSRSEGKRFANVVINLVRSTDGKCTLDFADILIISASFADQLIADLTAHLGFLGFMSRISFIGLSKASAAVIDESFRTRYLRA